MPPADIYLQIIETLLSGDEANAERHLKDLIRTSEQKGHVHIAKKLRQLKASSFGRSGISSSSVSSAHPPTESSTSIFEWRRSKLSSKNIILSEGHQKYFSEMISAFKQADLLRRNGLSSELKALLYGPPGTGKTLFVYALAGELDVPVMHIHIDSLISSYLGETGKNLRMIFEEARTRPCILFLDEFDAVAKQRDDTHELGELKRVVTVLLQNIDEFPSENILVAATNHEHLLDKAIWRRFNYRFAFSVPKKEQAIDLLKMFLKDEKGVDYELLAGLAVGMSGSFLRQVVDSALRKRLLDGSRSKLQHVLIEEVLRDYSNREIGYGKLKDEKELAKAIRVLRRNDEKLYTFGYLEELTGIPHSSLNLLMTKYAS